MLNDVFCEAFVECYGVRSDIGKKKRNAERLKEALNGSILTAFSVKDGYDRSACFVYGQEVFELPWNIK